MNNEDVLDVTLDEVDELYHHGVPGMKWGVRRTPAQLGHKTSSKKRRTKAKKYVENLMKQHKAKKEAKKAAEEERKKEAALKKKPISEMSDAELTAYINRKNAERAAYTLDRDIQTLKPEKVSAGQKFANAFKDKAISAVVDASGKMMNNLMNKAIEKALGDGAADAMAGLKKEAEKAGYQKVIAEAKTAFEKAKQAEIKTKNDADARAAGKKNSEADEAARKANETRSQQEYEKTHGTYSYSYTKNSSSNSKVHEGEVVNGKSYVSGYLSAPATASSSTRALGQSYIAGLLPAPKDDDD